MSLVNTSGLRVAKNGAEFCVSCLTGRADPAEPVDRFCKFCHAYFLSVQMQRGFNPRPTSVYIERCVVAIDLSFTSTGVCVMAGQRYETRAYAFGEVPAHPGERYAYIFENIRAIIREHQPHLVCAERAFVARGGGKKGKGAANMGVLLGSLHGAPQEDAFKNGAAWRHYDNASYRSAVLGFVPRGETSDDVKRQIAVRLRQMGVRFNTDDEADAYCLARYAHDLLRAHGGALPPADSKAQKKRADAAAMKRLANPKKPRRARSAA